MTKQRSLRWLITILAVLLWLGGITVAYFIPHKPFDLSNVLALLRAGLAVGVWLALSLVGAGLGRRLLPWLDSALPLDRLVLTTGLGLGLIGLFVLGLGLAGLLWRPLFWALLLAASALPPLRAGMVDTLRDIRDLGWNTPEARFNRMLRAFIFTSLGLTFLLALTPDTAWDSLVYHLTGPRLYAGWGRLAHPVDIPYLGFPQLVEMLYLAAMQLVSDSPAPLIHFGYGLLAVGITAALARRLFNREIAWLAAAILLSAETILLEMTWAYVDLALIFYGTAALYAFLCWREDAGRRWLALSGALAGLALATKYTALFVPLALGLALLWHSRRARGARLVRRAVTFAGPALLVVLPGLLENWLTTGNPFYPFLLPGAFWDGWRSWWYSRAGTGLAYTEPWRLLIAPLEATVFGIEGADSYSFSLGSLTIRGISYSAALGPLLLMGMPLWIVLWRHTSAVERDGMKQLLWFCGLGYAIWLVGVGGSALLIQARLLLPIFGALAVLAAAAFRRLEALHRPVFDIEWLAKVMIALVLALSLVSTGLRFVRENPLPYLTGYQTREDYYLRTLGGHAEVMNALNATLPAGAQVVFLWEPRSYLCRLDCRPDALLDRFLHLTYLYPDAAAIAAAWREAGVTHVLLYQQGLEAIIEAGFDPVTPRDLAVLAELQSSQLEEVYRLGETYVLYELKYR
ncbi:MAG: ArnT family glycosyltransferase [Anaerolineae bacterium]